MHIRIVLRMNICSHWSSIEIKWNGFICKYNKYTKYIQRRVHIKFGLQCLWYLISICFPLILCLNCVDILRCKQDFKSIDLPLEIRTLRKYCAAKCKLIWMLICFCVTLQPKHKTKISTMKWEMHHQELVSDIFHGNIDFMSLPTLIHYVNEINQTNRNYIAHVDIWIFYYDIVRASSNLRSSLITVIYRNHIGWAIWCFVVLVVCRCTYPLIDRMSNLKRKKKLLNCFCNFETATSRQCQSFNAIKNDLYYS